MLRLLPQVLSLAALCLADLASGQPVRAAQSVNVVNADFELGDLGGLPRGWTHHKGGKRRGTISLSAERAHTGKNSVLLGSEQGEYCILSSTPVACAAGQRFRAACYVFNEGNYEQLGIVFQRGGYDLRAKGASVRESNSARGKWTRIEVQATAPAHAETVTVQLYLTLGVRGRHYFDTIKLWSTPMPEKSATPLNIGTNKELFVDDCLIAEQQNVAIVLNPGKKHPGNPILRVEKPWEGWRTYLYGSVMFDEDDELFKMWYIVVGTTAFTCYPSMRSTTTQSATTRARGTRSCSMRASHNPKALSRASSYSVVCRGSTTGKRLESVESH